MKVSKCNVCEALEKSGKDNAQGDVDVNGKSIRCTIQIAPATGSKKDYDCCNDCFSLILTALKVAL